MAVRAVTAAAQGPVGPEPAPASPAAGAPFEELAALAERIQLLCTERGITVATAESCTGGLVGHVLTEVAGSSGYYVGGVVSYSDALKRSLLDVPVGALDRHGAVSAQVAVAMAVGARRRCDASIAVSVTGIAGPSGATPGKPIGLTYVGLAHAEGEEVRRHQWAGDRSANKQMSARAALVFLLEHLDGGG